MMEALTKLGFTVMGGTNLNHQDMAAKIGDFEDAAREADTTLFFYAGHGMQVDGRNYLVPVDAKLERPTSLQFETIDSDVVMRSMAGPGKTAIALLDACRDNPLSRSFSRSLGKSRSTAVQQGLATPSVPGGGILIGFATSPGEVAADGNGRNSPFTTALLKNINTPGLEIQQLMTRVKGDVYASTKETQEPWHNSSLRSEFFLVPAAATPEPVVQKQSRPEPPSEANISVEWNAVKDTNSIGVLDAFIAAHGDSPVFVALAEDRKGELNKKKTSEILDSLKIPEDPPPATLPDAEVAAGASAKAGVRQEALAKIDKQLKANKVAPPQVRSSGYTLDGFFDLGKAGNEGQTVYALLGPPLIDVTAPPKNPGTKNRSMSLKQITTAPSLDALLGTNPDVAFAVDKITSCRLDWIDRCPFLSAEMVQGLTDAMAAKGLNIANHEGNYYNLSRMTNSDDYVLSNAPTFRDGAVAIVVAIIAPDMTVRQIYGFDLDKSKLGVDAGAPEADIEVTGAAVDGDDVYLSFDSSYRCTDKPRRYGFIVKFSQTDRTLKWVSPLNVSDANLLFSQGRLLSANGGSCVDDYLYDINLDTGAINARAKLPTAVERMDEKDGRLTLELYDSAAVYQLP
jgi:Caspase domain